MSISRRLVMVCMVGIGLSAPAIVLLTGGAAQSEFAASHRLGENRIDAARLDIELGRTVTNAAAENMAPGDRRLLEVELRNVGTLPLVFNMEVLPDDSALGLALIWEQWIGPCDQDRPASTTTRVLEERGISIDVGETTIACFAAGLPLGASNRLQNSAATYSVVVDAEHDLEDR